ncbi:MAG: hypothetical protein U5J83_16575 [Bryobacterales bacterium]|nr:hypothetical protein [Bryobacterales bacterium]
MAGPGSPHPPCVAVGGRSDHARGALTHAAARKLVGGTPTLVSGTKYRSIDPLGRVLDSRQSTGPHVDYTFLYQYALGGNSGTNSGDVNSRSPS